MMKLMKKLLKNRQEKLGCYLSEEISLFWYHHHYGLVRIKGKNEGFGFDFEGIPVIGLSRVLQLSLSISVGKMTTVPIPCWN